MLTEIHRALTELEEDEVLRLVRQEIAAGTAPSSILEVCREAMSEVGARFERDEYFVSDLMMAGMLFKEVSALLAPLLSSETTVGAGKVVVGTVKGDIHDIGKDIVVTLLRSANFEVTDLGVDVAASDFVDALRMTGAPVLAMSGLLTLAFDSMKATIDALESAGLRERVKVMIGGGPIDASVCQTVGADDWGADAQAAVRMASRWISEQ